MYASTYKDAREKIKEGDLLMTCHTTANRVFSTPSTGSQTVQLKDARNIYAPCEGYVVFNTFDMFCHGNEVKVATVYHSYEDMLQLAYPFLYELTNDRLTGSIIIKWISVAGDVHDEYLNLCNWSVIGMSFSFVDGSPAVVFSHRYKTKKGTQLLVRFSDGEVLPFSLGENVLRDGAYYTLLDRTMFDKFLSTPIDFLRMQNDIKSSDYEVDDWEKDCVIRFASAFSRAVGECGVVVPATFENETKDDSCWVYLMRDVANDYYKIGISNNPEYRERTLQSEKPTIVKLVAKQYPSRSIARSIEASLHKVYQDKHIRGEWFSLTEKDVHDVINTLS